MHVAERSSLFFIMYDTTLWIQITFGTVELISAHLGDLLCQSVGLGPLTCWDFGLESCLGHGCLSLVGVVWCQVEVSARGGSLLNVVSFSVIRCISNSLYVEKSRLRKKERKKEWRIYIIRNKTLLFQTCVKTIFKYNFYWKYLFGAKIYNPWKWKTILNFGKVVWVGLKQTKLVHNSSSGKAVTRSSETHHFSC